MGKLWVIKITVNNTLGTVDTFDTIVSEMQINTIVRNQLNIDFDNHCMCLIPDITKRRRNAFVTSIQCWGESVIQLPHQF